MRVHIISAKAAGRYLDETAIRHHWVGDPLVHALKTENEDIWRREVVGRNEHERTGMIRDLEPLLRRHDLVTDEQIEPGDGVVVVPGHEKDAEVVEFIERAVSRGANVITPRHLLAAA